MGGLSDRAIRKRKCPQDNHGSGCTSASVRCGKTRCLLVAFFSACRARARDTFTAATLVATLRKTRDVKFFLVTRRLCVLPGLPFWTD